MPTWMHLWFVTYLLVYTLLIAAVIAWAPRFTRRTRAWLEQTLGGALLLPLPILAIYLIRRYLPPGWIDTHGLVDDWSAHAVYLLAFLFGFLLHRSDIIRAAVSRWWPTGLLVGLASYGGIVLFELRWPGNVPVPEEWRPLFGLLRAGQMWGTVVGLVGLADRYLNRNHRLRPVLVEAVFPFYIIHQTIILVVGYWLLPTQTGALSRFAILVATTWGGCFVFYLVGRRIRWLRPLIGLRRQPVIPPRKVVTAV